MSKPDYKSFAKWAIRRGVLEYGGLDGFDIQEMALKCGLVKETKYDPDMHGDNDFDVQPGDQWLVFVEEADAP